VIQNQVELIPAVSWGCPKCGRGYFESVVTQIISELDSTDLIELNIGPNDFVILVPDHVMCKHCDLTFDTMYFDEREDVDVEDYLGDCINDNS